MPQLEQGNLDKVAESAKQVAGELVALDRQGLRRGRLDALLRPDAEVRMASCCCPDNEAVQRLSEATSDITEYVVGIARKEGLAEGLSPLDGGVALHMACHARAQNVGAKAAEMLRLLPEADVKVIERCSGHGGSWGILKQNFETAIKVGRTASRQAATAAKTAAEKVQRNGLYRLGVPARRRTSVAGH